MHVFNRSVAPRRIWFAVTIACVALPVVAKPCGLGILPPPGAITASWYGKEHHGHKTASGDRFDEHDLTAAHPWLPFRTIVLVTNLANGRTVRVQITDRGPGYGRGIDLSQHAAELLGMEQCGLAPVRLTIEPNATAAAP